MKVIHYNIVSTRYEKLLKLDKVGFLYVMISQEVVDIAEYIWNEMVAFKQQSPLRANLPFVAMVTHYLHQRESPFGMRKFPNHQWGQLH